MALNNLLGFSITADDAASLNIMRVAGSLGALKVSGDNAAHSFDNMAGRMRDATTGRFAKRPEGVLNPQFLGEVGGQLKGVSVAALGFGTAIFGGLGYAAMEAAAFGKSVAEVASITDRAAFPISEIERIGKEMTSTYGGDLNLQVKTVYQAASSGATNAAEAIALMHSANKLAIGGLSDSFKAVDALTNVLNAYGMKMTESNQVSDALFTTAKIGKTTIDELASQIGRVAPTASAMGVKMDDLFAVITAGSTQLGNASAAIDGFKEMLSGIKQPTADAEAEARRLGITFSAKALSDTKGGFPKFLEAITKNAKFNEQTMGKLFGSMTAFNLASVLASNGGKAFSDALAGMENKLGATDFAFNTLAETADFANTVLKGNLQTAFASLGQAILPVIGYVVKFINKLLVAFNKASPTFQKVVAWVGVAAGAFAFLIGGLAGSAAAIAGLIVAGKALLIGLAVVAGGAVLLLAALVPLIAFGATLYLLWTKNIGGIATSVGIWFDRIKLAAQALIQLFSDGAFSGAVQQELQKAENSGIKQFAINAFLWFNRIKNFVVALGEGFSKGLERVSPIFEKIISAVQRLAGRFTPVKESLSSAKETFDKFGAAGGKTGDFLATIVEKIATGVLGVINFVDGLMEVWVGIKPAFVAAWDAAKGLFGVFGQLFGLLSGGGKASAQDTADLWRTVGNILGWVVNAGVYYLVASFRILGGIISFISGLISGIQDLFNGFVNNLILGVQLVVALFKGDFAQVWTIAQKMVENWAQTIVSMFLKVVGGAAGMIDSLGKIFGKDLGAQKGVQNFAAGLGANGVTAVAPGLPAAGGAGAPALPAAAAAQGQAQNTAAVAQAVQASNAKPIELNLKTQLNLDGQQLHEANQKAAVNSTGRQFQPTGDAHLK